MPKHNSPKTEHASLFVVEYFDIFVEFEPSEAIKYVNCQRVNTKKVMLRQTT